MDDERNASGRNLGAGEHLSARSGESGQPDDRLRYESATRNACYYGELYGQRDGDVLSERTLDK